MKSEYLVPGVTKGGTVIIDFSETSVSVTRHSGDTYSFSMYAEEAEEMAAIFTELADELRAHRRKWP